MVIGIISDIHANMYGMKRVLEELRDTEIIFCAGDIIGYYPFVNEVFDLLLNYNIISIKGNHDCYVLETLHVDEPKRKGYCLDYTQKVISKDNYMILKELPESFSTVIDDLKIMMFHGSPWKYFEEYIYPDYQYFDGFQRIDADIIILGHTHYPLIKEINGKFIINPGSCGQPRDYDPRVSCAILDTRTRKIEIRRCEYPVHKVIEKVKELGFPDSLARILERHR